MHDGWRQGCVSRNFFRFGGWPAFLASLIVIGFSLSPASAQTGTVAFSQSAYTANSSQTNAPITVIFSGSTDTTAFVNFSTSDGTATATVNYVATSNTLSFAVGANPTDTVNVAILGTSLGQSTQTVNLTLSNPTGSAVLGSPSTAVLTIINTNLQQIQFLQANYSVDDTESNAVITIVRTGGTNGTVAVVFSTSDGSAKAGVDYTATNSTVSFGDGVTNKTITIPILPPGSLETNQTVKLTLTNPTGGVALGNPVKAVLTIVATGPPVVQLSSSAYSVHEHVGHATVTAIRFGESTNQVTVNYATSDGTAVNGVDYLSTSGTLIFPPGASQEAFSFTLTKFAIFQSNKTVNVTLSSPTVATLGTQTTAVVTIVNDRTQTVTFTNSGGGVVTVMLRFAGAMAISNTEPLSLDLSGTDAGSMLTIKARKTGTGIGTLQIDQITGTGACRLIDARSFDVVGAGIELGDYLGELRIHDLLNPAVVTAGGSGNQKTRITAHNLDDGSAIAVGSRITTLAAARLGVGATIDAPTIGSISLKGDRRNGIPGDCRGTITISGDGIATNQQALANLNVSGAISNASITIANGSVGSVNAFQMIDSQIFVGYTPDFPANPLAGGGTFLADVGLSSVTIRSITNGFVNSDLAASRIGNVHLTSVQTSNSNLVFGVAASQHISAVSVRTPPLHWIPSGPDTQSLGDFQVLH